MPAVPSGRPLRNASYLAAANLGAKAFSFIFLLYVNRVLGKGVLGNYYLVLGYVGLFGIFTELGMTSLAVRDVVQDRSRAIRYVSNLLAVRVLFSLVAIALIVVLMPPYIAAPLHNAVYVYALALVPLAVSNTLQLVFQFSEQLAYSAVLGVVTSALISALNILALFTGHRVLALVLVFTAVNTVSAVVAAWLVYTRFLPRRLELDPTWWPSLLRAAAPFAALTLLNVLYNYADRQILAALSGCGAKATCVPVGEYTTAYRPLDILVMIFVGSINAATLPAFNRVVTQSRQALARLVRTASTLALAVGVPTALFGTFYAPEVLHVIGGQSFIVAAPALAILIWTFPCVLVLTMLYNAIYAVHKQRVVVTAFALTLLFNVVSNVLLIPRYSYLASAVLTVLSEMINAAIVLVALRRSIGPLNLAVPAVKMGLIAGVTAIILWVIHVELNRLSIFVGLPVGIIVVVLALRITRFLGTTEHEILGRVPVFGRFARLL